MTSEEIAHLGKESKIRLPTVDEVLDLGYAVHAADDPSLVGLDAQGHAKELVSGFMTLQPRNDTEAAYLSCVKTIALAHGRAITRRKRTWEKEVDSAQAQRRLALSRIRQSRHQNAYLNIAWTMLGPFILGLAGYLIAQIIGTIISDDIVSQTGHKLPSILMGAVFVLIGRTISFWISDYQRTTIELQCDVRCYEADIAYEQGKSQEHKHYRIRLCEAWTQYTGEEYPKTPSYQMVIEGDIKTREKIERQRLAFNRNTLWLLRKVARLLRRRPI